MHNVAVLGATGSIGASALDVIAHLDGRFRPWLMSAHRRADELAAAASRLQAAGLGPAHLVIGDAGSYDALRQAYSGPAELHQGAAALEALVAADELRTVLHGISGAAGLGPALAAARAGKRLALANKEALVMAGPLLRATAAASGAELLPVDSEHSAIFQCLAGGRASEVSRLILTASGGPFRELDAAALESVTPDDALRHPTWAMGAKITIDSAGLVNKALELLEARWLFDIEVDRLDVTVHPQSIVHSMVEFVDGSVILQASLPDMRLPIQYALTYPERLPGQSTGFCFERWRELTFLPPDTERFPGLQLGFDAARAGGTMGAVLNAANEVAAARFLSGAIRFPDITRSVAETMSRHAVSHEPDLAVVLEADRWAREEVLRCLA